MINLDFPVGNYKLHKDANFNYQLNRICRIGGDLEDVKAIAAQVTDTSSYIALTRKAADKAKAEGRLRAAAAYLRAAEFFIPSTNPDKFALYEEYKKLFYQVNGELMKENNVQRAEIPYEAGFMPVLYCINADPKGVVVIHGGFDSYVEEHLGMMLYVFQRGYSAYIFEGPGQGEVVNRYHIPFTPDWHKPVGAVLDYFQLDDVALMGISLGALLCKRAAAKEHRIKYLCSVGVMTSSYDINFARAPERIANRLEKLMNAKRKDKVNKIMYAMMDKVPVISWSMNQSFHVYGVQTPYDYLCLSKAYDVAPIADQITQDYLCLAGQNDHFTPLWFSHDEIDVMTSVRSFTLRIITAKEKGDDHCNVSNRKLMLDVFLNWLDETKKHIAEAKNQ